MIRFNTTSELWLSLEDYYNQGVTPEEAKNAIEKLPDPGSCRLNLHCRSMGINGNWIVKTNATERVTHIHIIMMIENTLDDLLKSKKKKKNKTCQRK